MSNPSDARRWVCNPCDVTWFDTSSVCWMCGADVALVKTAVKTLTAQPVAAQPLPSAPAPSRVSRSATVRRGPLFGIDYREAARLGLPDPRAPRHA